MQRAARHGLHCRAPGPKRPVEVAEAPPHAGGPTPRVYVSVSSNRTSLKNILCASRSNNTRLQTLVCVSYQNIYPSGVGGKATRGDEREKRERGRRVVETANGEGRRAGRGAPKLKCQGGAIDPIIVWQGK
ncbi:unnamed protein product [Leptosia nina]|uniref:Uncharacterized protein n=1 Tax=Leptosia nina TaxID=320188 RepID=A0AAV1JWB1_9NEOP